MGAANAKKTASSQSRSRDFKFGIVRASDEVWLWPGSGPPPSAVSSLVDCNAARNTENHGRRSAQMPISRACKST